MLFSHFMKLFLLLLHYINYILLYNILLVQRCNYFYVENHDDNCDARGTSLYYNNKIRIKVSHADDSTFEYNI